MRPDSSIVAIPCVEYEQHVDTEVSSSDDSWQQEYAEDLIQIQIGKTLTEVMFGAFESM